MEYCLVQDLTQMMVQHEDQGRSKTASTLWMVLLNNLKDDYRLVLHPMTEFYYLDDQSIHFDLIENYKRVIVDLALAGSEVMSFFDENSAKLVNI